MTFILKTAGYALLFLVVAFLSAVISNYLNDVSIDKETESLMNECQAAKTANDACPRLAADSYVQKLMLK